MNIYDVLNTARVEAGYEDRIPEINKDNLAELDHLPPTDMNNFLNVISKIVKTYVYDTTFDVSDNPFAKFYQEELPYGSTVEDLYVDLITGDVPAWNDDGAIALSTKKPSVTALYNKINYEMQYKVSTSRKQMHTACLNEGVFTSLVNRINNTLNSSAQYDLYLQTLELIATAVKRGAMKFEGGYSLSSEAGIKAFVKRLKTVVKDFSFMNTKYNYYGFNTKTRKEDIVIVTKPKYIETINVDYLAGVFNLSKAEISEMIIEVPDDYGFGSLDNENSNITPIAIVMDRRMLRVFPAFMEGGSIYNPSSLVYNTFLTLEYIFSFGLFFNGIVLCSGDAPTLSLDANTILNVTLEYNVDNILAIPAGSVVEVTINNGTENTVNVEYEYFDAVKGEMVTVKTTADVGISKVSFKADIGGNPSITITE